MRVLHMHATNTATLHVIKKKPRKTPIISVMCHRDKILVVQNMFEFHFCLSNTAFASRGPFQALSHISSRKPREADTSIHTHKEIITNTYTKVSPLGQSIRHQPLCRDWCSSARSKIQCSFSNSLFQCVLSACLPRFCPGHFT